MDLPSGFSLHPLSGSSPRRPDRRSGKRLRRLIGSAAIFLRRTFRWIVDWVAVTKQRHGWKGLILRIGIMGGGAFALYLAILWVTLPDISDPKNLILPAESTVITDRNGTELYRIYAEQDRTSISGADIPAHMKNAIVAIEDERFFDESHLLRFGCIDIKGIFRAFTSNLFGSGFTQGASTITQQLARTALLSRERSVTRKLRELMLACKLEQQYSKEKLLELYLNWIPFGPNAYGVEQASRAYFGISAKDLSLAQSAVLASLPQRPSYFNPFGKHVRTTVSPRIERQIQEGKITSASQISEDDIQIGLLASRLGTGTTVITIGGRTDQVLRNMQSQGFMKEAERLKALDELTRITFKPIRENIRAPHFVLWIREQLEEMFRDSAEKGILEQGGLTIKTTLDWRLQQAAEQAVASHKEDLLKRFGARNAALVALDTQTKDILAYVGNTGFTDDEQETKIDMVRSPRQPGSSFKPFVYAAAFGQGYGPGTVLYDAETKFGEDEPQNFDGRFWGPMTMRRALGASRNIPAIKAFFLAGGEDPILSLAAAMGAMTPKNLKPKLQAERGTFDYGWPLAIGAAETPLLEMAHAYSAFGSAGQQHPSRSIISITTRNGSVVPMPEISGEPEQVLDPHIAYQITSMLSDASVRPNEYWKTVLSVPGTEAAVKTGTSNKPCPKEEREKGTCKIKPDTLWTIGYTPMITAGVNVGNANAEALFEKAEALTTASPIWKSFMTQAQKILEKPAAPQGGGDPEQSRRVITSFPIPQGIVRPQISTLSGELPTSCTPVDLRRAEVFRSDSPPTLDDPACAILTVDRVTGLLASPSCPAEARQSGSFLIVRELLPDRWPLWQRGAEEWAARQMDIWKATPDHSGSLLPIPLAPKESCDPSLTPGRLEKPELSILGPVDGGTATYPSFEPRIRYNVRSSVQSVTYAIDGKKVATLTSAPFTEAIRIPRSVAKDGTHTLEVTLTDEYFNTVTERVSFRFGEDEDAPLVRFLSPEDSAVIKSGAAVTLSVKAEDAGSGIKTVEFYVDGRLLTRKPVAPYETAVTIPLTPGLHVFRAIATDLAGKKGEDAVTVTAE